jgi:hypothetical protein
MKYTYLARLKELENQTVNIWYIRVSFLSSSAVGDILFATYRLSRLDEGNSGGIPMFLDSSVKCPLHSTPQSLGTRFGLLLKEGKVTDASGVTFVFRHFWVNLDVGVPVKLILRRDLPPLGTDRANTLDDYEED